jgi:hypothetical protein
MRGSFEKAAFPGYGLDDRWQGTRWFGGSGGSGDEIDRLELAHGENPWDEEHTQIRVEKIRPRRVLDNDTQNIAVEIDLFTRQQVNKFWMSTGTLPDDVRRAAFEPGQMPREPTAAWADARIPIDGAAETFRILACDDYWVAQAHHDGMLVGIEARAWPLDHTGLVTIDDLSPYHLGSQLIAARGWSRFAQ